METGKYARRTFEVEAVQITEDNIAEVARWINPHFKVLGEGVNKRIMVPFTDRRGDFQKSPAVVGNWVTRRVDGTFRCYSDKRFRGIFEEVEDYQDLLHRVRVLLDDSFGMHQSDAEEMIDTLRDAGIAFRGISDE